MSKLWTKNRSLKMRPGTTFQILEIEIINNISDWRASLFLINFSWEKRNLALLAEGAATFSFLAPNSMKYVVFKLQNR